jgi:hypothetical protein
MREAIEEAWNFIDQKWRDTLNVVAAEPPSWGSGGGRSAPQEGEKKGGAAEAKKLAKAAVHVTGLDGKRHRQGDSGQTCMFKDVMCVPRYAPSLALQSVREAACQGEGEENRGQSTLPILPPS